MRLLLILLYIQFSPGAFSQPQQEVKLQIDSLLSYIKNKATESFAMHTVYRDDDPVRKWKSVYDPGHSKELKAAKLVLEEMKKALADCSFREFDSFKTQVQDEGTWYIYSFACGSTKKVHLAFLKIKGSYALGDIDVESVEEN